MDDREDGFSLVEMVMSMMLIATIAMAFFPLAVRATTAAATSSTLATATRLVSQQMEQVRAVRPTTCPAVATAPLGAQVGAPVSAGRGVRLQTWARYEGTCAGDHGLMRYVVSVTDAADATVPPVPLATATTLVAVGPR